MDPPVTPEDEPTLVRKARRGDASAFATLYHRHASAVHTLAYRVTGNTATAEDITQDTFLRMVQFLGGFRDGEPLRPWLKRVAANAAIDHLRRTGRLVQDDAVETRLHAAGHPSDLAEADGLLRRLSATERTVVWLHEMEGWSHEDLGRRFGHTTSWSKSLLSRALARLRADLEKEEASTHES